MLRPKIDIVSAALLGTLAVSVPFSGALAKPIQQGTGTFDCSCSGGSGTCSLSTSGPTMKCTKGSKDSCSGSCKLTTTPDRGSAAKAGAVKGSATQGGTKAAQ